MKKPAACISLALCLLCLVGFVVWTAVCIGDYQLFLARPGKSGIDYFMVGVPYAIGYFLFCSVGIPAGILCLKFCLHRWSRICGAVTLAASCLALGIAIWLFWL